jgi:hypothetical protein
MTKRKQRTFTEDSKKGTVRLIQERGKTITEIARVFVVLMLCLSRLMWANLSRTMTD